MKIGVVCRRVRWVGGKDGHEITEYEINSALIEALNSVERRAAIEIGQEADRADISLNGKANARVDLMANAFIAQELEAMRARMLAVIEAEGRHQVVDAPPDVTQDAEERARAASERPGKPGSVASTSRQRPSPVASEQRKTGTAEDPSVPKAPKSWRG